MNGCGTDHGLEFLLDFDGHIHCLEEGYWLKFEIKRVRESNTRPHGLSYSFTLHAPDGTRLLGFDNAHGPSRRMPYRHKHEAYDHWHRTPRDLGRPYEFKDALTLVDDFFDAVERTLREKGVDTGVIHMMESGK